MADHWIVRPPLTAEQGPTAISVGSSIRQDYEIIKDASESDGSTSLCWTGLSRQEVANLRNLARANELRDFLHAHNCGIGTGFDINMKSVDDTFDAKFYLTISTNQEIPEFVMTRVTEFVTSYRVH